MTLLPLRAQPETILPPHHTRELQTRSICRFQSAPASWLPWLHQLGHKIHIIDPSCARNVFLSIQISFTVNTNIGFVNIRTGGVDKIDSRPRIGSMDFPAVLKRLFTLLRVGMNAETDAVVGRQCPSFDPSREIIAGRRIDRRLDTGRVEIGVLFSVKGQAK